MDLGRLDELIERLAADGRGTTVRPFFKGDGRGGFGSDDEYSNDGWEVGWITGGSGSEIAVGPTLTAAVEQALFELGDVEAP